MEGKALRNESKEEGTVDTLARHVEKQKTREARENPWHVQELTADATRPLTLVSKHCSYLNS